MMSTAIINSAFMTSWTEMTLFFTAKTSVSPIKTVYETNPPRPPPTSTISAFNNISISAKTPMYFGLNLISVISFSLVNT